MLFLGFSAGLPLSLIFSSLALWLREAGIDRSTVTFFSWAALAYSFKFIWAPIIDKLPIPFITKSLGKRRAWIFTSQLAIVVVILLIAFTDPSLGTFYLQIMALFCVALGFSAATQDIVIDAYRIEIAPPEQQALLSSFYIAGYRIGMLFSGAGSLFIASKLGSESGSYNYIAWQQTYIIMALMMLPSIITTLLVKEPYIKQTHNIENAYPKMSYIKFFVVFILSVVGLILSYHLNSDISHKLKEHLGSLYEYKILSSFLVEFSRLIIGFLVAFLIAYLAIFIKFIDRNILIDCYIKPVLELFNRYGFKMVLLLISLISLYRISDIVLGVIANIFYIDIGYNKQEIAYVVKTFGLGMTLLGGFIGGVLSIKYGIMRILFVGALLSVLTNLLFMLLAIYGYSISLLYVVIMADNISGGIAAAALIAFLSKLTNISFTATQYAIFSSFMTLFPKIIGGYSGTIVENTGYANFFLIASLLGIPVLIIIHIVNKYFKFQ